MSKRMDLRFLSLLKLSLFVLYVALFFTIPLGILWGYEGVFVGAVIAFCFLFCVALDGTERIARRLGVKNLSVAEAPFVHATVAEYCRCLEMAVPRLGMIDSPALYLAVFGFRQGRSQLVVTRGLLEVPRSEFSALIGREIARLWHGEVVLESWLTQFISVLDPIVSGTGRSPSSTRKHYPFKLFLRQLLIYPLALVPTFLLQGKRDPTELDLKSAKLTRKPKALANGLRLLEAMQERFSFHVPFSCRHLFLPLPSARDPIARILFTEGDLSRRISAVEALSRTVAI